MEAQDQDKDQDRDQAWVRPWLLPGEAVVWSGRPANARGRKTDLVMAVYLGVGVPVVLGLMATQFLGKVGTGFAVLVAAIAVVGVSQSAFMVYSLLVRKPRAARQRSYALTDRRLLIGSVRPDTPAASWYRDQLLPPRLVRRPDGTTDILLSPRQLPRTRLSRSEAFRSEFFSRAGSQEAAVLLSVAAPDSFTAALAAAPASAPAPAPAFADPAAVLPAADPAAIPARWTPEVGEQVMWTGRPARVPWWFGPADFAQTLWTTVFPLFVAGMAALALANGVPPVFLVPCAALFAAGCYASFGRVFWRRARIKRSTYVVTDRRVICLWDLRGLRTTEAAHHHLLPPQIRPDGSLFFHRTGPAPVPARVNGWPLLMHPAALGEPPNFVGLAAPNAVAFIVAHARTAAVAGLGAGWG